jgi:hypothetical protein
MPLYNEAPLIATPARLHTLTESAEKARQAVRSYAHRKRQGELVSKHPKRETVTHPIPTRAARLLKTALALGFEARIMHGWQTVNAGRKDERKAPAVRVGGQHRGKRVAFSATWVDNRAAVGLWYDRPGSGHNIGVAEVAKRVGK